MILPLPCLGSLSVVSTPIGHREDMTYRAVTTLKNADKILVEHILRAKKLFSFYDIVPPSVIHYSKDNEHYKTKYILEDIQSGQKIAMIVDAGTPCISDPGYFLVREAIAWGIEPEIIPGASALTYAVVASGFPVDEFSFAGFLPKKPAKRRKKLALLADMYKTFFLFESPYRIERLLEEIIAEIGPETNVVIIREATKKFEERLRGTAQELLRCQSNKVWKGEISVGITTKTWKQ